MRVTGPLTNWTTNEPVRATADVAAKRGSVLKVVMRKGEVGRLYFCDRVENDEEFWTVWIDGALVVASNKELELMR